MSDEIHDLTRVDAYMRSRRRVAFLNAVWPPMLAGAVGAALMMGCVWIILPKVSTREIVVPAITMKETEVPRITLQDAVVPNIVNKDVSVPNVILVPHDVAVDHVVPRDVLVDHVVPHETIIDIPRVVVAPVAEAPPLTAPELRFVSAPEYQDAPYHGRIVMSRGGGVLSFADGKDFFPAHRDPTTSELVSATWRGAAKTPSMASGRAWRCTEGGKFRSCTGKVIRHEAHDRGALTPKR